MYVVIFLGGVHAEVYSTSSDTVRHFSKLAYYLRLLSISRLVEHGGEFVRQRTGMTTSRKRAVNTKYAENWHNFTFLKTLSGPRDDWQALAGTGRSINLKLGTSWCIVKLNVPVEELDMNISSPEGQAPFYASLEPGRLLI